MVNKVINMQNITASEYVGFIGLLVLIYNRTLCN